MKKFLLFALLSVVGLGLWSCSDDDDWQPVSYDSLPAQAMQYIDDYCGGLSIYNVEYDDGYYEVTFTSGLEIEFNSAGQWVQVDAPFGAAVPDGFVPFPIQDYVDSYYPMASVNEISRQAYGYEVELTNGYEIDFGPDGSVLSPMM